jgi:hypothetical protein
MPPAPAYRDPSGALAPRRPDGTSLAIRVGELQAFCEVGAQARPTRPPSSLHGLHAARNGRRRGEDHDAPAALDSGRTAHTHLRSASPAPVHDDVQLLCHGLDYAIEDHLHPTRELFCDPAERSHFALLIVDEADRLKTTALESAPRLLRPPLPGPHPHLHARPLKGGRPATPKSHGRDRRARPRAAPSAGLPQAK